MPLYFNLDVEHGITQYNIEKDPSSLYNSIERNGEKIPEQYIKNERDFDELFGLILNDASNVLSQGTVNEGKRIIDFGKIKRMYMPDCDEKERSEFFDTIKKNVSNNPYRQFIKKDVLKNIEANINTKLPGYIKARILMLCILAKHSPDDVFCGKGQWMEEFESLLPDEITKIELSDNERFIMDFISEPDDHKLKAVQLINPRTEACTINISYGDKDWPVYILPHGILRAVMCKVNGEDRITCLKGCLSAKNNSTVVMLPATTETKEICEWRNGEDSKYSIFAQKNMQDCAGDGSGGLALVTKYDMYTSTCERARNADDEHEVPIRCYGAGLRCAFLQEDCKLAYFAGTKQCLPSVIDYTLEDCVDNVRAAADWNDEAVAYRDDKGAWMVCNEEARSMSDDEFFLLMMDRFLFNDVAEAIHCGQYWYYVTKDGDLRRMKENG